MRQVVRSEKQVVGLAGKLRRFVPSLGTIVGKFYRFVPKLGTKKSNVRFFAGELTFSAGEAGWERGRPRPQSGGRDDRAPRGGRDDRAPRCK